jgi:hypothetical protein
MVTAASGLMFMSCSDPLLKKIESAENVVTGGLFQHVRRFPTGTLPAFQHCSVINRTWLGEFLWNR